MKQLITGLAAGALLAAMNPAQSKERPERDERWYFAPSIGVAVPDDDRNQEYAIWHGFGLGKPLSAHFSLELELTGDYGPLEEPRTGKFDHIGLGLNGRYVFSPDNDWRPFMVGGVGLLNHSSPGSGGTNEAYNLGGGLERTLNSHGTKLRLEARYRLDADDESLAGQDDFSDWLVMMGLSVPLGGKSEPPPPAPAPEPANVDSDGDGVLDRNDRCPDTPAGAEVDRHGCEKDSDDDGVPDSRDDCPETRKGAVVDRNGCERQVVIDLEGVHFAFDKATLRPASKSTLDAAVKILKDHPQLRVEVAGHTDSIGTASYNMNLSKRRARVVYDYLVEHGIDAGRLTTNGYGESQPIASNDSEQGRAQNRRTELVILGTD